MNYQKIIVVGRITANPEKKATSTGSSLTTFTVATNQSYVNKDGTKTDKVTYHPIVTFGKLADSCGQYLQKGQEVMVEGMINNTSWDKPDGTKGYRTEIVAQNVQFGSRPAAQSGVGGTTEPVVEYDAVADVKSTLNGKIKPKSTIPGPVETEINYPTEDCDPNSIPF